MESRHTNGVPSTRGGAGPHRLGQGGRGAEDVSTHLSVGHGRALLRTAIQTILLLAAIVGFAKGMGPLSRSAPRVPGTIRATRNAPDAGSRPTR